MNEILEKEVKLKEKKPIKKQEKIAEKPTSIISVAGTIIDTIIEWENSPEYDDFWA